MGYDSRPLKGRKRKREAVMSRVSADSPVCHENPGSGRRAGLPALICLMAMGCSDTKTHADADEDVSIQEDAEVTADRDVETEAAGDADAPADLEEAEGPVGETYYVSTTGDDANPGTQELPWKTIQKAADTMVAGDLVIVLPGTYPERVNVAVSGAEGAPIAYQAQGSVVMKGFSIRAIISSPYQVLPVDYITIRGFEIAHTDYDRWSTMTSAGVYIKGSHVIVENNDIHDCTLYGIVLYGTPAEPAVTSNCIIRNNRLRRNEMAGIDVSGRDNLIEGNEVWESVQCHPALMAVEDTADDNPDRLACPFYPGVSGLDADGMRFFGQGHVFRGNFVHDIHFGPTGIDPAIEDYNDNPHIDSFQTWSSADYNETARDILFEQNDCELLETQAENENGHIFMLGGGTSNLTIRNNIFKAYGGINTGSTGGAHHLYVFNNLWINDPSFSLFWPFAIGLQDAPHSIVKNNIFYDQPYHTILARGDTTGQEIDYNMAYNSDGSAPDCFRVGDWVCIDPLPAHDRWNVDPLFVDPGAGDYHLQPGSPAIDAGAALPTEVPDDHDGNARPNGAGYDIGPYEF